MRLIDLVTGDFVEFITPSKSPPYAILSHRWDAVEQTYQDIKEIQKLCKEDRRSSTPPLLPPARSHTPSSHNGASSSPPSRAFPPSIWDTDSGLSDKVRRACEVARRDGFRYLWIDSCCIDKTSSSELSESINSMFAWYRDAEVCYTFLADVPTCPFVILELHFSLFRASKWFTRGWTLQELIAPHLVVFLSRAWEPLGTKASLSRVIEEITGIPVSVLTGGGPGAIHQSLDKCSVAQRMSWAAKRETTKVEDEAYSLLGIFGIQMSLLYGEGGHAFLRLQEEILRRIPDQTIFAWGEVYPRSFLPRNTSQSAVRGSSLVRNVPQSHPNNAATATERPCSGFSYHERSKMMFARSPRDFAGAGQVLAVPLDMFRNLLASFCEIFPQEYIFTPHGIRTEFPLLPLSECLPLTQGNDAQSEDWYLAVLACELSDFPGQLLCCICHIPMPTSLVSTLYRGYLFDQQRYLDGAVYPLFRWWLPSSNGQDHHLNLNLRLRTVYLNNVERATSGIPLQTYWRSETFIGNVSFALPSWSRIVLAHRAYAVSLARPIEAGGLHTLTLSPRPPLTIACLHRWTITVEFSCPRQDVSPQPIVCATVRIVGGSDVSFTTKLEWRGLDGFRPSHGWESGRQVDSLMLDAAGHERVMLELGVQLTSAAFPPLRLWYRIHVDVVGGVSRYCPAAV